VGEVSQGTVVGKVLKGSMSLIANWRTTFHENGAITAQIGGVAPDGRLPAVVSRGSCKGPFTRIEADIPAPETAMGARRAGGARSDKRQTLESGEGAAAGRPPHCGVS
jgi:hypothetical protein